MRTGRTTRAAAFVALIAVVCIGAVTFLGSNASKKFSSVGNSIT